MCQKLHMLPVAPNDLAFSIHAVVLSGLTVSQIGIYDVSYGNYEGFFFFATISKMRIFLAIRVNIVVRE